MVHREKFGLAVVPFDTPAPGALRFSSLYRMREIEALEALDLGIA